MARTLQLWDALMAASGVYRCQHNTHPCINADALIQDCPSYTLPGCFHQSKGLTGSERQAARRENWREGASLQAASCTLALAAHDGSMVLLTV